METHPMINLHYIFAMSIIFIGQNSRSHPHDAFLLDNQLGQIIQLKKKRQEKYRQDLRQQIKLKNQRKHQQKLRDIQIDKKYQQLFHQQLAQKRKYNQHYRYYTEQKQEPNKIYNGQYQQIKYPQTDKPKRKQWISPLKSQSNNIQRYNIYNPQQNDNHHSRTHESPQNYYDKLNNSMDNHYLEDSQARLQALRNFQNKKIQEVYEMMQKSIKVLNLQEQVQIEHISQRMKPIKIQLNHLKKQRFKNRWQSNLTEPRQDFYRLPNIHRSFNSKPVSHPQKKPQNDINWKQWYARQKLKQLQSIYKKQFINEQLRSRLQNQNYRSITPGFYHSKFH